MTRTTTAGLIVITLSLVTAGQASAEAIFGAPPACDGSPLQPNQAFVYLQTGFGYPCYVLQLNTTDAWTAWDENYGLPNDSIKSVQTGSGVTLVLFWRSFYAQDNGATFVVPPGSAVSTLGSWNTNVSAARIQSFAANSTCQISEVGNNYMTLFTDANYSGDCNAVVIGFGRCYADPFTMGFRNDSLSSLCNFSPNQEAALFDDANFGRYLGGMSPWTAINLAPLINDRISSIGGMLNPPCQ